MKTLLRAGALALVLLSCVPVMAQEVITAPAGFVPKAANTFAGTDGKSVTVAAASPLPVAVPATIVTSANFTTPSGTTAYASGNLIANSATAGSVTPLSWAACRVNGGTGMVRRVRVKTTDTGFAGQTVRVHLHQLSPTFTNGDHAALLTTDSNYLGSMDVTFDRTFSDVVKGFGIPNNGNEINFDCASTSQLLYGEVEARATITPQGGKVMTVVVEVLAN